LHFLDAENRLARQTSTSHPRPHNPYAQVANHSKANNNRTSVNSQRTITPQPNSRSHKKSTQRRGSSRSATVPQRRRTTTTTSPSVTQQYPHRTGRFRSSRQFGATSLRVSTIDNSIGGFGVDSQDDDNDKNDHGKDQIDLSNRPSKRSKSSLFIEDSDSDDDDALFDSPR
jgi:hypothetical protein